MREIEWEGGEGITEKNQAKRTHARGQWRVQGDARAPPLALKNY